MSGSSVCVPGQRVCTLEENTVACGGTYTRNGHVYSSLAGFVHISENNEGKTQVEVRSDGTKSVVPTLGSVVTARVTNVNQRFCKCNILSVGKVALREPFRGLIRKEDVRAREKDRVEMYKCFRPGDVVIAKVLNYGDAHSYWLTTAENELGVVLATSEADAPMVPISWCEMQCPKTLAKEHRKVARVQSRHLQMPGTKS